MIFRCIADGGRRYKRIRVNSFVQGGHNKLPVRNNHTGFGSIRTGRSTLLAPSLHLSKHNLRLKFCIPNNPEAKRHWNKGFVPNTRLPNYNFLNKDPIASIRLPIYISNPVDGYFPAPLLLRQPGEQ